MNMQNDSQDPVHNYDLRQSIVGLDQGLKILYAEIDATLQASLLQDSGVSKENVDKLSFFFKEIEVAIEELDALVHLVSLITPDDEEASLHSEEMQQLSQRVMASLDKIN